MPTESQQVAKGTSTNNYYEANPGVVAEARVSEQLALYPPNPDRGYELASGSSGAVSQTVRDSAGALFASAGRASGSANLGLESLRVRSPDPSAAGFLVNAEAGFLKNEEECEGG